MNKLLKLILFTTAMACLLMPSVSFSQSRTGKPTANQDENVNYPFSVPSDYRQLPDHALIITTKGPFEVKLFRQKTPISVANLAHLGRTGFYEGISFHRYIPNFVVQGGDPSGTGKGGPGWLLPPEIHGDIHHVVGTIGWARKKAERNPKRLSSGSQFYICLTAQPRLDGFYTAFGVVVRGMENVHRLRAGDKILKVRFPVSHTSGW